MTLLKAVALNVLGYSVLFGPWTCSCGCQPGCTRRWRGSCSASASRRVSSINESVLADEEQKPQGCHRHNRDSKRRQRVRRRVLGVQQRVRHEVPFGVFQEPIGYAIEQVRLLFVHARANIRARSERS